jgi:hypothetical protein
MLVDGLTLLGNSEITNVQIEQVTAFPTTNLGQGRLIYLSLAVGGEQPGLYISEANNTWVPVGNITDLVAGTGMIVNTVNGVSTLSVNTAVLGAVVYQGTWNALTNTPALTSSTGIKGQYYTVSVGGTRNLDGVTVFQIGDMVIYSGVSWDKIDGAANEVRSVAGRTGDVLLSTADLAEASNLFYTDARARAALSVTGGALSYNQATGVLSYTATALTSSAISTALGYTPLGNASTVTAATSTKVTYNSQGVITAAGALIASDIPSLDYSKITSGKPTTIAGYGLTDVYTKTEINNAISASSGNKQTVRSTTPGELVVNLGTVRLYPAATMTLSNIFGAVNTASTGADIKIDVKKNGVSILNGNLITIIKDTYKSAVLTNTTQVTVDDFITVDIIQVGSTTPGSDLVVTIYYT